MYNLTIIFIAEIFVFAQNFILKKTSQSLLCFLQIFFDLKVLHSQIVLLDKYISY